MRVWAPINRAFCSTQTKRRICSALLSLICTKLSWSKVWIHNLASYIKNLFKACGRFSGALKTIKDKILKSFLSCCNLIPDFGLDSAWRSTNILIFYIQTSPAGCWSHVTSVCDQGWLAVRPEALWTHRLLCFYFTLMSLHFQRLKNKDGYKHLSWSTAAPLSAGRCCRWACFI